MFLNLRFLIWSNFHQVGVGWGPHLRLGWPQVCFPLDGHAFMLPSRIWHDQPWVRGLLEDFRGIPCTFVFKFWIYVCICLALFLFQYWVFEYFPSLAPVRPRARLFPMMASWSGRKNRLWRNDLDVIRSRFRGMRVEDVSCSHLWLFIICFHDLFCLLLTFCRLTSALG